MVEDSLVGENNLAHTLLASGTPVLYEISADFDWLLESFTLIFSVISELVNLKLIL